MKVVSLFTGIDAWGKGLTNLGIEHEVVAFAEFEKHPSVAYCAIHGVDPSKNLGDITQVSTSEVPDCDLITYSPPCQSFSVAGKQLGFEDERGVLFFDAFRIIEAKRPKYALMENVQGLTQKKFIGEFEIMLDRLEGIGYNNYWQVLNSKDLGIPQNRNRVFIISIRSDIDDGTFEFPEAFDNGLRLKDMLEEEVDEKYYIKNERAVNLLKDLHSRDLLDINKLVSDGMNVSKKGSVYDKDTDIANCLLARDYKGLGNQSMTVVLEPKIVASRGRNPENPSDRTTGSPTEQRLEINEDGVSNTLTTVQKDNLVLEPSAVRLGSLYDNNGKIHQAGAVWDRDGLCPTIDTMQGGNREPLIIEGSIKEFTVDDGSIYIPIKHTSYGNIETYIRYRIRKLTPLEVWRLMGFYDRDYEIAKKALEDTFYNGGDRSNSQMYKMAGNSICVPVIEAIYKKLFKDLIK